MRARWQTQKIFSFSALHQLLQQALTKTVQVLGREGSDAAWKGVVSPPRIESAYS